MTKKDYEQVERLLIYDYQTAINERDLEHSHKEALRDIDALSNLGLISPNEYKELNKLCDTWHERAAYALAQQN